MNWNEYQMKYRAYRAQYDAGCLSDAEYCNKIRGLDHKWLKHNYLRSI
jgi:hypothetical protein